MEYNHNLSSEFSDPGSSGSKRRGPVDTTKTREYETISRLSDIFSSSIDETTRNELNRRQNNSDDDNPTTESRAVQTFDLNRSRRETPSPIHKVILPKQEQFSSNEIFPTDLDELTTDVPATKTSDLIFSKRSVVSINDNSIGGPDSYDHDIVYIEGPPGPQGPQGIAGPQGPWGPIGPAGPRGPCGPQGPKGPLGLDGPTGPEGSQGRPGPKGDRGEQGPLGQQGPAGPEGPVGSRGGQGGAGPQGPQGKQGPPGPPGIKGDKGDKGEKGDQGGPGIAGPVGSRGPQGPQGPIGPAGPEGKAGPEGPEGRHGSVGPKGDTGHVGPAGVQGNPGKQGHQGLEGPPGSCVCNGKPGHGVDEHIIIVNTDYQVKPSDRYIVINSTMPRVITLYALAQEISPMNVSVETHAVHIKSTVASGNHKIIVANSNNNINGNQPSYSLPSHQSIRLVPTGSTWYSF